MARDSTQHLPLVPAYEFGRIHGLEEEIRGIKTTSLRWKSKTSSVRRGYIIVLFQSRGIFDEFVRKHWSYYKTKEGQSKYRGYLRLVLLTSVLRPGRA